MKGKKNLQPIIPYTKQGYHLELKERESFPEQKSLSPLNWSYKVVEQSLRKLLWRLKDKSSKINFIVKGYKK